MNPLLKSVLIGIISAAAFTFAYNRVEAIRKVVGPAA